jgi:hypothetical protein
VTYAAGKTADIVIWIAAKATDEYIKAVEWLNRRTDNNIDFYLIEIQIWKIDDTLLIPRFKVIARPSPKEKYRKLSKTDEEMIKFWEEFNSYACSIPYHFFSPSENFNAPKKPHPENSYDLYVNGYGKLKVAIIIVKKDSLVKTGVYIPNDKNTYLKLLTHKDKISKLFASELEWNEGKQKSTSVYITHPFSDFSSNEGQNKIFEWLCNTALIWKDVIKKYC